MVFSNTYKANGQYLNCRRKVLLLTTVKKLMINPGINSEMASNGFSVPVVISDIDSPKITPRTIKITLSLSMCTMVPVF